MSKTESNGQTLSENLLKHADRMAQWHVWELGMEPVPDAMNYKETAILMRDAADALAEAEFLLARLNELEWSGDEEETFRDFAGHVEPPMARLSKLIRPL